MNTTTTIPTPQELLARAADIMTERGWAQGNYVSDDGCVCAVGAIHSAAAEAAGLDIVDGFLPELPADIEAVADAAEELADAHVPGGEFTGIVFWNDSAGRTGAEVIAALRTAAEGGV